MKRVLVTGATGFIGRQSLAPLLARNFEIHAITNAPALSEPAEVRWHSGDLMDAAATAALLAEVRPSHLLHFAWFVEPGKFWTSPENVRWLRASLGLLEAFAAAGGQRVVMAGSCTEYDWRVGECVEGVTALVPASLYGTCKNALQQVLEKFAEEAGLSAAWGRIFFLYGPQEARLRLVPSVILSLLRGEAARCTHGQQVRDFMHVADVADAFAALLDSAVRGPVNVASGQAVKIAEVVGAIAAELGRPELVQLGAVAAPANEPQRVVASVRRLTEEVKWSPRYDLEAGLSQTIDWWRETLAGECG
jgi:nucleoside-diphosphate-sugar epimerase